MSIIHREICITMDIDTVTHKDSVAKLSVKENGELKKKWTPAQLITVAHVFSGFASTLLAQALEIIVEVERYLDNDGNLCVVNQDGIKVVKKEDNHGPKEG